MIYFSGIIENQGKKERITATSKDHPRTILHKALDLEFWGEISVFDEMAITDSTELPERYIMFSVVASYFNRHAANHPIMERTVFDVTFVTQTAEQKRTIPDRICKTLIDKGFFCTSKGRDIANDGDSGYFATVMEFSLYGGVVI